ncbi:MAG TPA: phosphatase PAP2 family protein [Candidatus Binataceae bacterium]|nr:phosphatase PAP2 family protein [Candidatus Binataceae bacterium]
MPKPRRAAWALILLLGIVDRLWAGYAGLSFTGWTEVLIALALLFLVVFVYSKPRPNPQLADAGHYAALWVAFSVVGSIFTYLAATMHFPLQDAALARIDAAMGFNWLVWMRLIGAHRWLERILSVAYATFLPQLVGSALYFAHTRQPDRNDELLWIGMLALVVTTLIFGLAPATGAADYFKVSEPGFTRAFLAIRSGSQTSFSLGAMEVVISMPSYHTVIAIALIYVHRPPSRAFIPMLVLNGLMLLAVPSEGSHYLIDMVTGGVVAAVSIAVVRAALKPTSTAQPLPGPAQTRRART